MHRVGAGLDIRIHERTDAVGIQPDSDDEGYDSEEEERAAAAADAATDSAAADAPPPPLPADAVGGGDTFMREGESIDRYFALFINVARRRTAQGSPMTPPMCAWH